MIRTAFTQNLRDTLSRGAASLDAAAAGEVRDFIGRQRNPDGGFRGRSSESDIYYTVFGLECARALGLELAPDSTQEFLRKLTGLELDFVHFTCLVRCLELQESTATAEANDWMPRAKQRLAAHLSAGGGYHGKQGQERGSVYDSFLGMLANEALSEGFPHPEKMLGRLEKLRKDSGAFANDAGLGAPTTPVTAAALGLGWELKRAAPEQSRQWLLARLGKAGGFAAAPLVPVPDLLSTATALHALRTCGGIGDLPVNRCLEFVQSVWDDGGGFYAHAWDPRPDCEYTFYALLALGNLVSSTPT